MNKSIISIASKKPQIGERVFIADGARLIGDVKIGDDSSVFFNSVLRADIASISIGKQTNIQDNVSVHLSHDLGVSVGDNVTVGHNAILHACTIEDFCLIGMGSIIMDGAHIRKNSIVAAGAVVPAGKEYPEASLIVGVPARVLRSLTVEEMQITARNNYAYVDLKNKYIEGFE